MSELEKLNEKLAIEVMGWVWDSRFDDWMHSEGDKTHGNYSDGSCEGQIAWAPAHGELDQLQMCWKMLTLEQKAIYKQLVIDHDVQSVFESPEQHAELILRAKEIS